MPRPCPNRYVRRSALAGCFGLLIFLWFTLNPLAALAATWTGGGADNNWSTGGNWLGGVVPGNGDVIEYDNNSTARLNQTNDIVGLTNMMIDMDDDPSGNVTINGNEIGIADGARDAVSSDFSNNRRLTINAPLRLTGSATITAGSVTLAINSVDTNGFNLTLDGNGWDVMCNGTISGSGNVTYENFVWLIADHAYTGSSILENGANVYGSGSLPSASALEMRGASEYSPSSSATVASLRDDGSGNGQVVIDAGDSFNMGGDNSSTTFTGTFSGSGSLIKTGGGTFTFSGTASDLTSLTVNGGTFELGAADILPDALTLTLGAGGTFSLSGNDETIGNFSGSGTMSLGTGHLTFGNASNTSFSGNVTSTWASGATINKQGSGSFTVPAGPDIVTGAVLFNLNGGTFALNRNWGIAFMEVNNGATLAGNGNLGPAGIWVHAGGTLSPGNSPGRLAAADALALDAGSTLAIELDGTTPITEHDQVVVGAGWNLPGNLSLSLGYAPTPGDSFMIIENFGGLGAPFAGLPQGGVVNAGGYAFQINYLGGDGNDVVLTCVAPASGGDTPAPEPEPTPDARPAPEVKPDDSPSPAGSTSGPVISWPKVGGTNHYNVYRANCPTCAKTQVGRVPGTSFTDESALPGQVYYYFVRSDNGALSDYSDWIPAWRYEQNPGRAGDFNADGIMDLLWWDPDSNQLMIWLMNSGAVQSVSAPVDGLDISQWLLVSTGDFNGDGVWDLLWWNADTGEAAIWYMSAQSAAADGWTPTSTNAGDITGNVTLSYPGDLNGDGKADLLWRDYATGQVTIWLMGDDGKPSLNGPPTLADGMSDNNRPGVVNSLEWTVRGLYDMDGDSKADVVWQHASDGRVVVWRMDGSQALGFDEYQSGKSADWRVAGLGDMNGDGRGDLVWRNDAEGAVQAWLMTSGEPPYEQRDMTVSDQDATDWRLNATGDFCGDGCADIYCMSEPEGAKRIVTLEGQEFTPSAP